MARAFSSPSSTTPLVSLPCQSISDGMGAWKGVGGPSPRLEAYAQYSVFAEHALVEERRSNLHEGERRKKPHANQSAWKCP